MFPDLPLILKLIELKKNYTLILYTCRKDKYLDDAVEMCKSYGLTFDYINENDKGLIETFGGCRKIFADYYLDNQNINLSQIYSLE